VPGQQVVVYSAQGLEYWYNNVLTSFELDCGVSVFIQFGTSDQMVRLMQFEKASPVADVVIAEPPYITVADDGGLLQPGGTPGSAAVPDDACGHGRDWCTLVNNYASWVYNPNSVPKRPRLWNDLLGSSFRAGVLESGPDQAIDGLALVVLLDQTMGRTATFSYLTMLERQVRAHYAITDTMSRVVASGGANVANGNLRENLNDIVQYGSLAVWFPSVDAVPTTIALPYGAGLIRGGRNPSVARALLTYLWSVTGQQTVGDAYAAPGRPDIVPQDARSKIVRSTLRGVDILHPDWETVAHDQQTLIAMWQRLRVAPDGTPPPAGAAPPTTTYSPPRSSH
jgi:2-aminoethylphosphonate transport system substrate-binding protein